MSTFVFSYRNPIGYSPTPESRARWMAWFDSMGGDLVDLGKPAVGGASVGNCDSATTELGGYSLVRADSLEGALDLAKGCPHLDRDGGVEVGLLGEVTASVGAGTAG
jgi:hypothetical protein